MPLRRCDMDKIMDNTQRPIVELRYAMNPAQVEAVSELIARKNGP
jgi:hypothetical protein